MRNNTKMYKYVDKTACRTFFILTSHSLLFLPSLACSPSLSFFSIRILFLSFFRSVLSFFFGCCHFLFSCAFYSLELILCDGKTLSSQNVRKWIRQQNKNIYVYTKITNETTSTLTTTTATSTFCYCLSLIFTINRNSVNCAHCPAWWTPLFSVIAKAKQKQKNKNTENVMQKPYGLKEKKTRWNGEQRDRESEGVGKKGKGLSLMRWCDLHYCSSHNCISKKLKCESWNNLIWALNFICSLSLFLFSSSGRLTSFHSLHSLLACTCRYHHLEFRCISAHRSCMKFMRLRKVLNVI